MENNAELKEESKKFSKTNEAKSKKGIFIIIFIFVVLSAGLFCFFEFLLPSLNIESEAKIAELDAHKVLPLDSKPQAPLNNETSVKRLAKENDSHDSPDTPGSNGFTKYDGDPKKENTDCAEGSATTKIKLNQLLKEIVYLINNGQFKKAYETVRIARKINNLTQLEKDQLEHLESLSRISNEYENIDCIRYNVFKGKRLPVQVMLEDLSAYNGTISKREYKKILSFVDAGKIRPKGEVVVKIKYAKTVRYVSINYKDIAKIIALTSEEDLNYYWADEIETKRNQFLDKPKIEAVDKLHFAFFLKRVAPKIEDVNENELLAESQELFQEAIKEDKYIWQSYKLSKSKNYYEYLMLIRQNKRSDAKEILIKLFKEFPYANQLIVFKNNSENATQQMIENIEEEGLNGAKTESQNSQIEKIEDKNLDNILQSSISNIIEQAKKMYAKGLELDKNSLAGTENSEENIEKAKYYYLLARQLYTKASKKGQEVDNQLVEVNRALYWLRKRSGF